MFAKYAKNPEFKLTMPRKTLDVVVLFIIPTLGW